MESYSPVALHPPVIDDNPATPTRGFFALIKNWMGRVISLGVQAPISLYRLIFRVQYVASPILKHPSSESSPSSSPAPLKKDQIKVEPSPKETIPSPIQKKEKIKKDSAIDIEDIFEEEEEEALPILENIFKNIGFDGSIKEVLLKGIIFDTKGKKIESADLDTLTGTYQVEWNYNDNESDRSILLYKGQLKKGMLHGQGAFLKQESSGRLFSLLEGTFEQNIFTSGIIVQDDSYIDGTFTKGYRSGKGTIHYFKTDSSDDQTQRYEYQGEFANGFPHGKGKLLSIESEVNGDNQQTWGVRLIAEGEFKEGKIVEGRWQNDSYVFEGKWLALNHFEGKVTNVVEQWQYEGSYIDNEFEEQGRLIEHGNYTYDVLEKHTDEDTEEEETVLRKKNGGVTCTNIGEFKEGDLFNGRIDVSCSDGKKGHRIVENGDVVKTEIFTLDGLKYEGEFPHFTLDGQGKIYDSEGEELYSGQIKCGYPHGKGRLQEADGVKEGFFKWGQFQGLESFEDEYEDE